MREVSREKCDRLLTLIENGATIAGAAEAVGVGEASVFRWARDDREFGQSLKKARVHRDEGLEEEAIAAVRGAFAKDWKSAAWWLERTRPHRFALRPTFRSPERESGPEEVAKARQRILADPSLREQYAGHLRRLADRVERGEDTEAVPAGQSNTNDTGDE